jgi:RHS repeat-associated protein
MATRTTRLFRSDPMKFTGHKREYYGVLNVDNNDYLDYMHARYYNPNHGRFLAVDADRRLTPARPQSWNRYVYSRNNPIGASILMD